jgi:hypothetical protein
LGGVALVGAPLILLAGALTHPTETSDASRQLQIVASGPNRWYLAHLLYVVGFAAFVPAVLALGRRLRATAPALELWGTGLAVVGLFASAGIVAVEGFGGWLLAQASDRAAAAGVYDRIGHSAGIVVPFGLVGLAIPIGLVVLAVGLARARAAQAWTAWTLAAGAVLLGVGLAGEVRPALVLGIACLAVAMATVGLADLGASTGTMSLAGPSSAPYPAAG